MGPKPTLFLSSTVLDLQPIRDQLGRALERRGFAVLMSERPDFPVPVGSPSHDACLANIRDCDAFVLLIGQRFGGRYRNEPKSVTWREWEEALTARLSPIVLINACANELAQEVSRARKALLRQKPGMRELVQDKRLLKNFPDANPIRAGLPAVQRFIDSVRKGHADNWVHADWDGTIRHALRIIDSRLAAQLNWYKKLSVRQAAQTRALHDLVEVAGELAMAVARRALTATAAAKGLLLFCKERRQVLFDFRPADQYNFMLYKRRGARLLPGPRVTHPHISQRNRTWNLGLGHIGLAVKLNAVLAAGDLDKAGGLVHHPRRTARVDRQHYVSAVSVPLHVGGDSEKADAAFIVTSNRVDQFPNPEPGKPIEDRSMVTEQLTAVIVGRMLERVLREGSYG